MKEYPYISIILLEFWRILREELLEGDMFVITGVAEHDGVYGVRFMKESWQEEEERMLDLPVAFYKKRLSRYRSVEREIRLREIGI
jgi:hypothetical protein